MTSTINGSNHSDNILGTNGADCINGKNGDDTINGLGGNDIIDGGNGNDTIDGGNGIDLISGGNGDDTVYGGNGNDIIDGDNGNDTIDGGANADLISGGKGDDRLIGGSGNDIIYGGRGTDTAVFAGNFASYTITPSLFDSLVVQGQDGTDFVLEAEFLEFDDGQYNVATGVFTPDVLPPTPAVVSLTPAAVVAEEGGALIFTFTRTGGDLSQPLTINYVVNDGPPLGGATRADGDFSYPSGIQQITFAPGQTTATITVQTNEDSNVEADESFPVLLAGGAGYTVDPVNNASTGVIQNDDSPPPPPLVSVVATDGIGTEAAGDSPDFTFTFTRTGDLSSALTVNYGVLPAPIDGAQSGSDFPAQSGTITFAAGSATAVLSFDAIDDTITENTELFSVVVAVGAGYVVDIPNATANASIIDNDPNTADYSWTTLGVTVDLANDTATGAEIPGGSETLASSIVNVIGGSGNDTLRGDTGDNDLFGGDGNDFFTGGLGGNDLFDGGAGTDRASFSGSANSLDVQLAAGIATIGLATKTLQSIESVRGTNQADTFDATGFSGSSVNAGSNGTFNEFEGLGGNDIITGNGNTRVSYLTASAGVNVNIGTGTAVSMNSGDAAGIGSDSFTGVNSARGSEFDDQLLGGNDNDHLIGGAGNDLLGGGGGSDILDGGAGSDTAVFGMATGPIVVDLAAGTASNGDSLISIENVNGSTFNDVLRGTAGSNTINGNDGNDILIGREGSDVLNGGNGIDVARYVGPRSDYTFAPNAVTHIASGDVDTTSSVELLQFDDSYMTGYAITPIDLSTFGLAAGVSLFGRNGANDVLFMGGNANGRFIDLQGGTDTLTLSSNPSYFLNLANVENVFASGATTVGLQNAASGMTINLGSGFSTLNLANGTNNITALNVETLTAARGTIPWRSLPRPASSIRRST